MQSDRSNFEQPDWNQVWQRSQQRYDATPSYHDSVHLWGEKKNAARYDLNSREQYSARVQQTIRDLHPNRKERVLDIGAGPGTLALPLSPLVRSVTTVEPAGGMVEVLKEHIQSEGIDNITCIQKRWEDVNSTEDLAPPYDLVIVSFSLVMIDLWAAISKMNQVTDGLVALYWFVDNSFWEQQYLTLWPELHHAHFSPGPKADIVFNLLYQHGIYADIRMFPADKTYRFRDMEEAYQFFAPRFSITDQRQEGVLRTHLDLTRVVIPDGVLFTSPSTYARISWRTDQKRSGSPVR
ncbi:class I SAM-dependent methyltransferase [Methanosphaerula palustris]|uniref:Methyltransferase type 11 n=1 Tax=Methanosphaerula palustris (strain ATCC BAA-1556 / DSM 19958 / E1-9c) TaxID=521011 RepID=B8GHT1_METPE|nr:class I SAM-dependent methyltransferase [Methanosphaerula palustris]ACL15401.1 Methyltransferase type 11 [Methanosphaerula palustris E1-9c]